MARLEIGAFRIGVVVFLYLALSVPPNFSGEQDGGGSAPDGRGAHAERSHGAGISAKSAEGNSAESPLSRRSFHTAALLQCYSPLVEKAEVRGDDVVFSVRGREIHYREGRMLAGDNLDRAQEFDSIFYDYGADIARPAPEARPRMGVSDDFLDALVGGTEREVRAYSRLVSFLGHRVFVHSLCADALERVDSRIRERAASSAEVRDYVARIKIVFSMKRRYVRGTASKSYHAYGLALDVIPSSYGRKAAYWMWSAVLTEKWDEIPLSERWSPPREVVEAFEENGFVWGGKWRQFDTVHFEYRPEILASPRSLAPPASRPQPVRLTPRRE